MPLIRSTAKWVVFWPRVECLGWASELIWKYSLNVTTEYLYRIHVSGPQTNGTAESHVMNSMLMLDPWDFAWLGSDGPNTSTTKHYPLRTGGYLGEQR